ncbi:uncharacterized protein LOC134266272 [Saccostrea cucullata]|uniref:uncharacterized protein LOC134266272 n=1 Tax=Saccostrea cuccullata TaxID=36930 RepID=UPI002ECFDBBD
METVGYLRTSRFKRFSIWKSLLSAIRVLLRIATKFRKKNKETKTNDTELITQAENQILRAVQLDTYPRETEALMDNRPIPRTSSILKLAPFIDDEGIIRVGDISMNRLSIREDISQKVLRKAGFWITGGKRLISSILFHCVICRRLRGKFVEQKMSDLPRDRLTPCPPFTFVGVDVFGPWDVLTRRTRGGSANSKRWAVIFTCLYCRAVHFELIEEMSTGSFINAMRRFYAIRGEVKEFRSDRGTNFVGAADVLHMKVINVEDSETISMLEDHRTGWKIQSPSCVPYGWGMGAAYRSCETHSG